MMFRRTMVASEDAIERSWEIYGCLGARLNNGIWRMPHGGRIGFGYLDNVKDADARQGRNLTDVWIEEAGPFPPPPPHLPPVAAPRASGRGPGAKNLSRQPRGPRPPFV